MQTPSEKRPRIASAVAVAILFILPILIGTIAYYYRFVGGLLIALTLLLCGLAYRFAALRGAFTFLASLFLALTVAELIEPVLYHPHKITNQLISPHDYWHPRTFGWVGSKGDQRFAMVTPDGRMIYDVIYTIGDDGFRVTPVDPGSGDQIVFYGDSFTFGEGLKNNETLPYYFAQLTGRPVKNYGFHAYGVQQPLSIMKSDLDTSGAVNFLLTAPWHAERAACKVFYSAGSPKYEIAADGSVVETGLCRLITNLGPLGKIINFSNLYQLYLATRSTEVTDADYDRYLAIIGDMARISRERGQKFVIGFVRADESLFKGTHFTNEIILNRLRTIADEVLDLTLAPRNEDLDPKYYLDETDKHPSALANQARAKILKEYFERQSK